MRGHKRLEPHAAPHIFSPQSQVSLTIGMTAALLPAAAEQPKVQVIHATGAVVKKAGPWFRSEHIRVEGSYATIRLDFSELKNYPDARIVLDIQAVGSVCNIYLPVGTEVEEDVENAYSVIKVRSKGENRYRLGLLIHGKAERSVIKVKTRGR